jgi:type 1 fimbria pilin
VADDSGTVGTPIHVTPCDEAVRSPNSTSTRAALQAWSIEDTGHGFLRLSNPVTGLALEIDNDNGVIRTNVVGAVRAIRPIANLDPPQQWQLEHVG